uniref:hypothetical protein n=1 Tax=Marinovum sp. TaxID=2024839 RepID=UPI002B26E83C
MKDLDIRIQQAQARVKELQAVNRQAILTPYRHSKMTPWIARVAGPMRCSPHTAQPYRASG